MAGRLGEERYRFMFGFIMEDLVVKYSAYFTHIMHHRNAKDQILLTKFSRLITNDLRE